MIESTKPKRLTEKWSDAQVTNLRELLGTMSAGQIGAQIGRTKSSVLKKVTRLGLHNRHVDRSEKWSLDLIEKLKTLGPTTTAKAFMAENGLTKDSVYNHAKKFKIKFVTDVFWTQARIEIIRQKGSASEAAKALGVGRGAVLRQAKRSGIILKETRTTSPVKKAPERVRMAQKRVPAVKARYKLSGREERSRIEWCPICHSPVSNWIEHSARMGCRRPLA
jgi:hypothetical protein